MRSLFCIGFRQEGPCTFLFILLIGLHVCLCTAYMPGARGGLRTMLDPWALASDSCKPPCECCKTEPRSFRRAVSALNNEAIPPAGPSQTIVCCFTFGLLHRWSQAADDLQITYENLTGDVLVAAGVIAYLGAFTSGFRQECTEDWSKLCKVFGLQYIYIVNV
jgi:hypothetical protein